LDYASEILKKFLNLYWVRPETAFWRTLDVLQMKSIKFKKPILDIGCGDGSFSFTNFGGEVDSSFDVYRTMKNTSGFFSGVDIHDQNKGIKPKITKQVKKQIDVGLDWKENLLSKAKGFELYEKLIYHDSNKKFPFKEKTFETIFSNTFYWLKDIETVLKESRRICTENGKIIIFVPDKKFKDSLIYNKFLKDGYKWAKILDRGIFNNVKHCYSLSKWESIFSKADLQVTNHSNYATENLVKIWNIGMRPYSPFIIEMANKLKLQDRTEIKKRVISELFPILRSYLDFEMNKVGKNNCFHMFVLSKKKN
jgi:SAM-dependent methyltransferase